MTKPTIVNTVITDVDIKKIRSCFANKYFSSIYTLIPVYQRTVDDKGKIYSEKMLFLPAIFYASTDTKTGLKTITYVLADENNVFIKNIDEPFTQYSISTVYLELNTMPSSRAMLKMTNYTRDTIVEQIDRVLSYITSKVDLSMNGCGSSEFLALWCVGTFFYDIFPSYSYLWFNGQKRTGKSTALETIAYSSFYGNFVTDITPASIYREVDATGCTLCFDEAETLMRNDNSDIAIELIALLNSGYKSGASVPRVNTMKNTLDKFLTYSPKAFASIQPIDETLESRSIRIIMRKMNSYQGKKPMPYEMQDYRDIMYLSRLLHASDLHNEYNEWIEVTNIFKENNIRQRDFEIFSPIIFLASKFKVTWMDNILKFIIDQKELKDAIIDSSIESAILAACKQLADDQRKNDKLSKFIWVRIISIKEILKNHTEFSGVTEAMIDRVLKRQGYVVRKKDNQHFTTVQVHDA